MTPSLAALLGFVDWTLVLLSAVGITRVSQVLTGKARPNAFPAGVPHGSDAYWRLNRAHLNCVENLPIVTAIILTAALIGVRSSTFDTFAVVLLVARVGQSIAHISSGRSRAVLVRFSFFATQVVCMAAMVLLILRS